MKIQQVWFSSSCSFYPVIRSSDGRTALELCGPCGYVLRTQAEVVVGRLHRQRGPGPLRLLDHFQWLCRGQVNYVAPHPGTDRWGWLWLHQWYRRAQKTYPQRSAMILWLLINMPMFSLVLQAEFCNRANGLHFHDIWPGLQKRGIVTGV